MYYSSTKYCTRKESLEYRVKVTFKGLSRIHSETVKCQKANTEIKTELILPNDLTERYCFYAYIKAQIRNVYAVLYPPVRHTRDIPNPQTQHYICLPFCVQHYLVVSCGIPTLSSFNIVTLIETSVE